MEKWEDIKNITENFYDWDSIWEYIKNIAEEKKKNKEEETSEKEETKEIDKYIKFLKQKEFSELDKILNNEDLDKDMAFAKSMLYLFRDKENKKKNKKEQTLSLNNEKLLHAILEEEILCKVFNNPDRENEISWDNAILNNKEILKGLEDLEEDIEECKKLLKNSEKEKKFEGKVYVYDGENMSEVYIFFQGILILKKEDACSYYEILSNALSSRYQCRSLFGIAQENMKYFLEKKRT